jgi:predicted metal-dependent hydrolase
MQLELEFEPAAPDIYFVRQRRARRYLLRVDIDGRVRVTIPRGGSRRDADDFARRNLEWIRRQQSRIVTPPYSDEDRRAFQEQARRELPPRLLELATIHGLTLRRISIRNQRLRWGSCGPGGHICLNWRLVLMPDWVRDYVLIHELMHLRRMDHSPRFWAHVAEAFGEYQAARQWLRTHGRRLR